MQFALLRRVSRVITTVMVECILKIISVKLLVTVGYFIEISKWFWFLEHLTVWFETMKFSMSDFFFFFGIVHRSSPTILSHTRAIFAYVQTELHSLVASILQIIEVHKFKNRILDRKFSHKPIWSQERLNFVLIEFY